MSSGREGMRGLVEGHRGAGDCVDLGRGAAEVNI